MQIAICVCDDEMKLAFEGQEVCSHDFHVGSTFAEKHHFVWLLLVKLLDVDDLLEYTDCFLTV